MSWLRLFWDFEGRVGRTTYWMGLLVVVLLAYAGGPLQRTLDRVFESASNGWVERTGRDMRPHAEAAGDGEPTAQKQIKETLAKHMAGYAGLTGIWFIGFLAIALVVLRALIALVLKRSADAGFSRAVGWSPFALLFLANVLGPVPWLGAGFQLAFLAALICLGLLPSRDTTGSVPTTSSTEVEAAYRSPRYVAAGSSPRGRPFGRRGVR